METVNGEGHRFILTNDTNFEALAGQFQRLLNKIICIKDGTYMYLFSSSAEIPPYLKYESETVQPTTGITEYYFRSTDDESLYAFFYRDVCLWLTSGRQGSLILPKPETLRSTVTVRSQNQQPSLGLQYPIITIAQKGDMPSDTSSSEESDYGSEEEDDDLTGSRFKLEVKPGSVTQDRVTSYRTLATNNRQ